MRPRNLATDKSPIIETLFYSLKKIEKIYKKRYDYLILLQPTAPNRTKNEIDTCIRKIINKKAESLISLSPLNEPHPFKLKKISKGFAYNFLKNAKNNQPRQSLPKLFKPSGNIYIFSRKIIIKKNLNIRNQAFHLISEKNFLNIDTPDDLCLAKLKLKKN